MEKFRAFVLGLSVAVGAAAVGGGASAQVYQIGTNPQGSMFYSSGASISALMVQKTGVQFRVAPYGGSSTYLPLINNGQLAFGMVNAAEAAFAYSGTELFGSSAAPRISAATAKAAPGRAAGWPTPGGISKRSAWSRTGWTGPW